MQRVWDEKVKEESRKIRLWLKSLQHSPALHLLLPYVGKRFALEKGLCCGGGDLVARLKADEGDPLVYATWCIPFWRRSHWVYLPGAVVATTPAGEATYTIWVENSGRLQCAYASLLSTIGAWCIFALLTLFIPMHFPWVCRNLAIFGLSSDIFVCEQHVLRGFADVQLARFLQSRLAEGFKVIFFVSTGPRETPLQCWVSVSMFSVAR